MYIHSQSKPHISHQIIEVYDVNSEYLDGVNFIKRIETCTKELELNIVSTHQHQFDPFGMSLVLILKESHLAVHSWPENGYMHIDLVTCSKENIDFNQIYQIFKSIFQTNHISIRNIT